jgi:hypothetical protein
MRTVKRTGRIKIIFGLPPAVWRLEATGADWRRPKGPTEIAGPIDYCSAYTPIVRKPRS